MRHRECADRKIKKNYADDRKRIRNWDCSNVSRMDAKAYERFKSLNTDYGTGKCSNEILRGCEKNE